MLRNGQRNLKNTKRAQGLRGEMSASERVLWERLRVNQTGFKFRRQCPVGAYVLDYYCTEVKLCVEVDGEQHAMTKERDAKRDANLAEIGVVTLRIPSLDLFDPMHIKASQWIDRIVKTCEERSGRRFFERDKLGR